MVDINEVKKGIYSHFISSPKLYYSMASEKAVFPYCVYQVVSEIPEDTFTEEISEVEVQFNVFSNQSSSMECDLIAGEISEKYKEAIPVSGHFKLGLMRTLYIPSFQKDGAWQSTVSFQGYIEKE